MPSHARQKRVLRLPEEPAARHANLRYSSDVPLPEAIPVTFTEEDAQYLTVRPVQRQSLRPAQLCELILSVTGRDPARVGHILRAGTIVYNFYRYRWSAIEATDSDLESLLAQFPGDDPSRIFRQEDCTSVLLAGAIASPAQLHAAAEFPRADAQRRPLVAALASVFGRGRNAWDLLMQQAARGTTYTGYSYAHKADLFGLELQNAEALELAQQAAKLLPRSLRPHAARIAYAARLLYVCPRP